MPPWLLPLVPILGVVVGGVLTTGSTLLFERWRARRGQSEALREAYVEFIACAESILHSGKLVTNSHERRLMADTRLKILEKSAERRALVKKVWDAIPTHGTPDDYEWDQCMAGDPEADWPPFREAMKTLQERIRKDLLF
jgi:hypothetical protein